MKSLKAISNIGLAALLVCGSSLASPAFAQSVSQTASKEDSAREGLPGRRVGGGVRRPSPEACLTDQQAQIALSPESNLLLTAKADPTFLFYLPSASTERTVEFVLANEKNEEIYVATTQTKEASGIVRLDLSKSVTPVTLEAGQNYRWYLSVVCDASDRANDLVAEGWIKRADAETSPMAASNPDKTSLLADSLANLDMLRRSQPEDAAVSASWNAALASLGLESLTDAAPVEHTFDDTVLATGF